MLLRVCLLLLFSLLSSVASPAQQLPPKAQQLRAELARANALLGEIEYQRDSLASLSDNVQDSASLKPALDSLQKQYSDSIALTQRSDSLEQAFTSRHAVINALNHAEIQLKEEVSKATVALARELLPGEAQTFLTSLQQAGKAGFQALPSPPTLNVPAPLAPPELQGLARARAMKAAGNHLLGHKTELNKARRELDRYKGRFDKVESVKDMPKGFLKLNPLKDKPWPERVFMGSQWQFGNQERFVVDIAPYAAWRWTDKFSSGAGVQYRLSVSLKERPWVSAQDKVGGVFAFTDVDVYKGIFARVQYEHLTAPVKPVAGQPEAREQDWVPGLLLGAGKRYTFYKAIQGYALMQYNLLHEHQKTPYLQPFHARIGFFLLARQLRGKRVKIVKIVKIVK